MLGRLFIAATTATSWPQQARQHLAHLNQQQQDEVADDGRKGAKEAPRAAPMAGPAQLCGRSERRRALLLLL